MNILTLNCWIHSIHYTLCSGVDWSVLATGELERVAIGGTSISQRSPGRESYSARVECVDHRDAIALVIATLTDPQHGVIDDKQRIAAVGHRIVHGGERFREPVRIDQQTLATMRTLTPLAPLHNEPNIAGTEACMSLLPAIPHIAVFDTAFHQTMPECAYLYPLPYEWYEAYGVRRFGFHGPSHLYLSRRAATLLGRPVVDCNLVTIHCDRGVSLCALRNGISVDTSMGLTPLEGAIMDTRCGDIDPGIPAFMIHAEDLSLTELNRILNLKSGFSGILGRQVQRRDYLAAAMAGDPQSVLALQMESHRLKKYIGAYLAAVGPVDAIAISAGTGEPEWISRQETFAGMECLGIVIDREKNRAGAVGRAEVRISAADSPIAVFVIPSDEERVIAEEVMAVLSGDCTDHAHRDYSFSRPGFRPVDRA